MRGIFADGWIGSNTDDDGVSAGYSRFVRPEPGPRDDVRHGGRKAWCSDEDMPGGVIIRAGTLKLGPERNGVVDKVTDEAAWQVRACAERTFPLSVPRPPSTSRSRSSRPSRRTCSIPNDAERPPPPRAQVSFDWRPGKVTLEQYLAERG